MYQMVCSVLLVIDIPTPILQKVSNSSDIIKTSDFWSSDQKNVSFTMGSLLKI